MTQICQCLSKAIFRPFGDHAGELAFVADEEFTTNGWLRPPALDGRAAEIEIVPAKKSPTIPSDKRILAARLLLPEEQMWATCSRPSRSSSAVSSDRGLAKHWP
jgi:hypothetical protein